MVLGDSWWLLEVFGGFRSFLVFFLWFLVVIGVSNG